MSDLVGIPEDRFSRVAAPLIGVVMYTTQHKILTKSMDGKI